MAISQKVTTLI